MSNRPAIDAQGGALPPGGDAPAADLALLETLLASAPVGFALFDPQLRFLRVNAALAALSGLPVAGHLRRTPAEIVPALAPTLEPALRAVLETGQPVLDLELACPTPDNAAAHWLVSCYPVRDSASCTIDVGAVFVDITARKRAEATLAGLYNAEQQARATAALLGAANLALARSLELETVLGTLLNCLHELVPYDCGCVMLLTPEGALVTAATRGYTIWNARGASGPLAVPEGDPLVGRVLEERRSLLLPRIAPTPGCVCGDEALAVQSGLGVPLIAGGTIIGVAAVGKTIPEFFTTAHLHQAETLAGMAAVALQNARLFAEVNASQMRLRTLSRQLVEVQEAERRHLARELHDEIGQMLTGLNLMLEVGSDASDAALRQRLHEAQVLIRELMGRVRELSLDLRPAMLDDLGLVPTLHWHFRRYTAQTGIVVDFAQHSLPEPLTGAVAVAAYRIVQEALTNVARYASVARVDVRLSVAEGRLRIEVADQGVGFEASQALAARTTAGLAGMRERVLLLGGQLRIEAAPGVGTRLMAELPLHDPQHREG